MTKGTIAAIVTGIMTLAALLVSGALFFMSLLVLLNGFMGQERAVNGAFITYILLVVITLVVGIGGGGWLTYYLTERRKWHAAGSAIVSIILMCSIGISVHLGAVIAAAIVADQLRVKK
jgi:hypothetical protein